MSKKDSKLGQPVTYAGAMKIAGCVLGAACSIWVASAAYSDNQSAGSIADATTTEKIKAIQVMHEKDREHEKDLQEQRLEEQKTYRKGVDKNFESTQSDIKEIKTAIQDIAGDHEEWEKHR